MFDWDGDNDDSYCDGTCWDSPSCNCIRPDDDWELEW